jgi:hypothetical protein
VIDGKSLLASLLKRGENCTEKISPFEKGGYRGI